MSLNFSSGLLGFITFLFLLLKLEQNISKIFCEMKGRSDERLNLRAICVHCTIQEKSNTLFFTSVMNFCINLIENNL